jgi:hypothetical protein
MTKKQFQLLRLFGLFTAAYAFLFGMLYVAHLFLHAVGIL